MSGPVNAAARTVESSAPSVGNQSQRAMGHGLVNAVKPTTESSAPSAENQDSDKLSGALEAVEREL